MAEKGTEQDKKHTVTLLARKKLEITGVTEVESFDDRTVQLVTDCGELTLEGEGLHIGTLDIADGRVTVEGAVSGLYYSDRVPARKGLRGKLFG